MFFKLKKLTHNESMMFHVRSKGFLQLGFFNFLIFDAPFTCSLFAPKNDL